MNRRDDDRYPRRENNFDRMYDAREYGDGNYSDYDDRRRDGYRRNDYRERGDYREEYDKEPKKRSFFRGGAPRKRDREEIISNNSNQVGANQFVVMTPKSFDDIQGIIDNLKAHRALIVDLCKLNQDSVQRVMDYVNGAIYALDGSIQRINTAVFLLTPTGMGISVPIDYIKDKWERNKKR